MAEKSITRAPKERKYNKQLARIAPFLNDLRIKGDQVLVRLFKFEKDTTTDSGVIVPKFKTYETEGGRAAAKLDDEYIWQHRGVIVAVGDGVDGYDDKDLLTKVWLSPAAINPRYQFLHERTTPTLDFEGYILINPAYIQAVELN